MIDSEQPGATEDEFQRLCDFLYRRTGLHYTPAKRYYIDRRLAERMTAIGAATFANYFAALRADVDGEVEQIVNSLTVNETYFYREDHQLRVLTSSLLPDVVSRKRPGQPIRIWSVPCSTGEEPYSIAIWLLENWPAVDDFEIEILGSDIDTRVLAAARDGHYGERALSRLSAHLRRKYFEPAGEGRWHIVEGLRESIQFTGVNLVEAQDVARHGRFDVIFCRNVLIYFDDASRRLAAGNLYDALEPGGYICLGHAESMSRISPLFEVCRYEDAIVYRRPRGDWA
jgi:chemotaxis protein methyltransferase CheR